MYKFKRIVCLSLGWNAFWPAFDYSFAARATHGRNFSLDTVIVHMYTFRMKPFFQDGYLIMPAPKKRQKGLSKEAANVVLRERYAALRLGVLIHYCGGSPHCQCPGCRTTYVGFLQMDHVNGDGAKHLTPSGKQRLLGTALYKWLRKNNYPEGFQVLCANCNGAKGTSAACPCAGTDH